MLYLLVLFYTIVLPWQQLSILNCSLAVGLCQFSSVVKYDLLEAYMMSAAGRSVIKATGLILRSFYQWWPACHAYTPCLWLGLIPSPPPPPPTHWHCHNRWHQAAKTLLHSTLSHLAGDVFSYLCLTVSVSFVTRQTLKIKGTIPSPLADQQVRKVWFLSFPESKSDRFTMQATGINIWHLHFFNDSSLILYMQNVHDDITVGALRLLAASVDCTFSFSMEWQIAFAGQHGTFHSLMY